MRFLSLTYSLLLTCLFWITSAETSSAENTVNAWIGDQSFTWKYGISPDGNVDETLRIQTHLEYVEHLLRQRDTGSLSATEKKNRARALDLLHDYRSAGLFPQNFDFPGTRVPCFIDRDGRICAVGYLIEKTAGREVAEQINALHQYEKIMDMHDPVVESWAASIGLTLEECAMIQPTYNPRPYPSPKYPCEAHTQQIAKLNWLQLELKDSIAAKDSLIRQLRVSGDSLITQLAAQGAEANSLREEQAEKEKIISGLTEENKGVRKRGWFFASLSGLSLAGWVTSHFFRRRSLLKKAGRT